MTHSKMLAARRRKQKIRKILMRAAKLAKKQEKLPQPQQTGADAAPTAA
ncbi:MAG: hypothetical protein ACK4N4_10825 [Burkholderiales bacterium]